VSGALHHSLRLFVELDEMPRVQSLRARPLLAGRIRPRLSAKHYNRRRSAIRGHQCIDRRMVQSGSATRTHLS
jgi:hypothetical protein